MTLPLPSWKDLEFSDETVLHVAVQVLTAPTPVAFFGRDSNSVESLVKPLVESYKRWKTEDSFISVDTPGFVHSRHFLLVQNLKFVLRLKLQVFRTPTTAIAVRHESVMNFLCLLEMLQNLSFSKRHLGTEHILHEGMENTNAFFTFFSTHTNILSLASRKLEVECWADGDILRKLIDFCVSKVDSSDASGTVFFGHKFSFFLPLQRFVCNVLFEVALLRSARPEFFTERLSEESATKVAGSVMDTVAACCQIMASMWRRTGTMIFNQAHFYFSNKSRRFFLEDVRVLLVTLASIPAIDFLMLLLKKMSLFPCTSRIKVTACWSFNARTSRCLHAAILLALNGHDWATSFKGRLQRKSVKKTGCPSFSCEANFIFRLGESFALG